MGFVELIIQIQASTSRSTRRGHIDSWMHCYQFAVSASCCRMELHNYLRILLKAREKTPMQPLNLFASFIEKYSLKGRLDLRCETTLPTKIAIL